MEYYMNHLTGLDALFLHLETPQTPMHVGGFSILELPQRGLSLVFCRAKAMGGSVHPFMEYGPLHSLGYETQS
jgi:hypothetical protein